MKSKVKLTRKLMTIFISLFYCILNSQVGINTPSPNPNSILDIVSSNKGVLLPRLTTNERDNIVSIGAAETGLTIFNTSTKCYNIWNGTLWYDTCGNTDGKSNFSINCNTASLSSDLVVGEPANSVITLEINASSTGTWSIQSNTVSGVSYSGSGIITAAGPQLIRLTATGTPTQPNNNALFTFNDTQTPSSTCSVSVKIIERSTKTYTVMSLLPEYWNSALGSTNSSFTTNLRAALASNFSPSGTIKIAGFNFTQGTSTESLASFISKLNSADILWCGWPSTNDWRLNNDKIQAIKAWIDNKKGIAIFHADDNEHAIFANMLGFATPYYGNQAGTFTNQNEIPLNGSFGDLRSLGFPSASSGANQSAVLGGGKILATGTGANSNVSLIIMKDNSIVLGNIDWAGNSTLTASNIFGKLYMNIFEWAIKKGPIK
ncbi:hypothetical protein [Chryseobacterium jejuense]|uniref:hypothetical protein n=1 Tax=Chryseobacterium jejuense TaxID=445960 RepID=UPI001AE88809|nr:hypothetical protein [Chryseobacterium jejuense]MBP2616746.1 hypothetical protein [Chryseobacterium jejuense]